MRKRNRFQKMLALLLIAVVWMMPSSTPFSASALTETAEQAEAGAPDSGEPAILCEDVSKRGAYEKHFARSDGSFIAATYAEPVHYQNAAGEWVEIDNHLVSATEDGAAVLKNRSGPLTVAFACAPSGKIGSIRYADHTLRWSMTAKAAEDEQLVTLENPDGEEETQTPLPDILTRSAVLSSADLLNPEVFSADLTIKRPDQEFVPDASAVAEVIEEPALSPADAEMEALAVSNLTGTVSYDGALPGIDLIYTVHSDRVKEEIVLREPTAITSYRTRIEAAGLTPVLQEDQSVEFASPDGEVIFDVPAPFMFDANGAYSEEIVVRLEQIDANTCELIYIPSYEWLHDATRVYPVTIDPTYQATPMMYGSDKTQDTYVYSGSPNSNYYSSAYLKVGRNYQSYVKFPTLPDLGSNYMIYSAQLRLVAVSDAPVIRLCRVTGNWSSSTLTWNNQPGASAFLNLAANGQFYLTYDVTEVVSGWYSGKYPNYGFMIQDPQWSDVTEWNLYSSDCGNSNVMPGLQVCYYPMIDKGITTGTYFIKSYSTGKYLDIMNWSVYNESNVGVSDFCGHPAQQWYVENHGNGLYSIRSNINRSYYLDVDGGQDANEQNVQIYLNSNQRFRIMRDATYDYTTIVPSFSNTKSLDIYGGSDASKYNVNVQLYRYSRSGNQLWVFEKANNNFTGSISGLKNSMSTTVNTRPADIVYNNNVSDCIDTIIQYDAYITYISNIYRIPKAYMQTLLMRELYYINPSDSVADGLVIEYFAWEQEVEAWYNSAYLQLTKPFPSAPSPLHTDSSTGLGQIFASTCINAQNYVCGTNYDWNDWKQRQSIWESLKYNNNYNIEAVAWVILYEMHNLGLPSDPFAYSDSQIKALFAKYNGTGTAAVTYGEQCFEYYKVFRSYLS